MPSPYATGHVREIQRKSGPVLYAKLKLPDGREPQRRLGRLWEKRNTPPPPGYVTRRQAEARLEAILAGDDPMVNITPSRATFQMACDERLRYLEHDKQRKRSTITDYANVIEHDLVPWFGAGTPVDEISTYDVDALKDHLLARVSHRTAQKVLVIMHGVMARAKRKGWIDVNPCENAEKVTVKRSDDFNVLSVEQVHAVSRAAASELLAALFVVAAFTGLRMGELLALRWRHVDFAGRLLHVQRNYVDGLEDTPKSHRRRSPPLADQAVVALDAVSRREHFTGPDDLVFCDEVGGHLTDNEVRDEFYAALERAGLGHLRYLEVPSEERPKGIMRDDPIVFHDLRHTMGTLLAAAGVDLRKIQAWMGHADIQTTMRYTHYVPAHDDAARMTEAFTARSVPPDVPRTGAAWAELSATQSNELGSAERSPRLDPIS